MVNRQAIADNSVWVLLVTDGTVIMYPPEIYRSLARALVEAERWAWVLAGEGVLEVERPFGGRWRVADRDVRLVEVHSGDELGASPWVGTYWTRDGYPDPEAVLLEGKADAREWVSESPRAGIEPRVYETAWFAAGIFNVRGEEEYAVAHLAKVVL